MKLCLLLCLGAMLSFQASYAAPANDDKVIPDIIVASRLDISWSEMLISKLRRYVMNLNLGDPFRSKVEKEIEIAEVRASDMINRSSRNMVQDISSIFGLRLLDARSKIIVKNIEYQLDKVTTDLRPISRTKDGQVFEGLFAARGVMVNTDEIRLIMEIPTTGRRSLPLMQVTIRKPFVKVAASTPVIGQAQIKVNEGAGDLSFEILNSSFVGLADIMTRSPEAFELGFESIEIPQVSVQVGNRRMNIDPDKVRQAILSRQQIIKELLLEQLQGQLRGGIAQAALDMVKKLKIPNEYWVTVDKMQMKLKISRIAGNEGSKNVYLNVESDFCTQENYGANAAECVKRKATIPAASVTTQEKFKSSIQEIRSTLERGDANMVASISEDYINKLVSTTVDAGYFDQKLMEAGASFGPTKTFVRLDKAGDTGTLYVDIRYKITGVEAVLVGGSEIRFPLVLKCTMRIEKGLAGFPVVIFKVKEAVLDNNTLRRGFPQIGLPSTVERLRRFESKVVKKIRKEVAPMVGQDIISLELPVFKDVGLESLEFLSDGHGRMSAHATLEEALLTTSPNN